MKKVKILSALLVALLIFALTPPVVFAGHTIINNTYNKYEVHKHLFKQDVIQKNIDNPYGVGTNAVFHLHRWIGYAWYKPNSIQYEYRYDKNNGAHSNFVVIEFEFWK